MTAWWVLVIAYALVIAGVLVMKGGTKRATVGLWLVLCGLVCVLVWLVAVIRS